MRTKEKHVNVDGSVRVKGISGSRLFLWAACNSYGKRPFLFFILPFANESGK